VGLLLTLFLIGTDATPPIPKEPECSVCGFVRQTATKISFCCVHKEKDNLVIRCVKVPSNQIPYHI